MAKTSKTTSSTEAKKTPPKKGPVAKSNAATKKATPAKKAPVKKATAKVDPATQLENACKNAVAKFQKIDEGKYQELREKLEWCIGSYNYDKNPEGMVEYGRKASDTFKEIRKDSPRKVAKKLVDDLDKALSNF